MSQPLPDSLSTSVLENIPIIIGSLTAIIIGTLISMHDSKDFAKLTRLHHWQYGFPIIIGGFMALGYALGKIIESETQLRLQRQNS